jgi:hypothetical protein
MTLRRTFVLLFLGLASATSATAQSPLIVLDSIDLDLSERSAGKQVVDFLIPAKLNVRGVAIRRWSISQGGKLINPAGSEIKLRDVADQHATLSASFDLASLSAAGAYVATVEFTAPEPPKATGGGGAPAPVAGEQKQGAVPVPASNGAPPPAVGAEQKPAVATPPKLLEQTVQLKLTKPAAELRVSTPLQLTNTIYSPWGSGLEPNKITFNETGGKSFVRIDPTTWNVELRRGNDPTEASRLTVQLPSPINGFGQAAATVSLEGPISIGTVAGTLTVRTTQLAAQTADFALTIVTRLSAFWLAVVIVIGIVLGWIFRNRLDARRARLEAVIPAEQEIAALDALIDKTADPKFLGDFEVAKATLVGAIDARSGTADSIKAATTAATARREAISKEMGDLINKLRPDLYSWQRLAAVSGPLPDDVTREIERLRTTVQGLSNRLDDNLISGVDADVKRVLPEQKGDLIRAIEGWLGNIDELKGKPPKAWPDTRLPAALPVVSAEADRLRQALGAADTTDKLWQVLLGTAHLLRSAQDQLFRRALGDARTTAEAISKALIARDPKLKPETDAIDEAAAALPNQAAAGTPTGADTLVTQLDTLRRAIVAGLRTAWNDEANAMPGLEDGRFIDALAALAKKAKPGEKALGPATTTAARPGDAAALAQLRIDLRRSFTAQPDDSPPQWKVELEAPDATVSEAVVVRARVAVLDGRDPPRVTLRWYQDGNLVGITGRGTFEYTFKFAQPGSVLVQVAARDATEGESVSARLIIQVRAVHGARAIRRAEEDYDSVVSAQNLMSGAIILLGGWLIFSPTFVGTFAELFAAFLWGFSVDIGAAKVRELTDNVKALKPAIPIPKTP